MESDNNCDCVCHSNNDPSEEWRPVVGYEGYYEISSKGRLRSLPRSRAYGMVIRPSLHREGYIKYYLSANGKQETIAGHRLVAKAFIPNPENKRTINHKDADRTNNNVENLEWNTVRENNVDMVLRNPGKIGKRLDPQIIKDVLAQKHLLPSEISKAMNLPHQTVVGILKRDKKKLALTALKGNKQ